jgi:hypothetical protein
MDVDQTCSMTHGVDRSIPSIDPIYMLLGVWGAKYYVRKLLQYLK